MFLLLIIAAAVFIFLNFSCINYYRNTSAKFRYAVIYTLLFISAFVYFSTEFLSAFNLINTNSFIISWGSLLLLAILNWLRWGRHIPVINLKFHFAQFEKKLFAGIFFISFVTLITAIISYPNNWDSMTYHLARVAHWMQNGNVKQYPTQIDRQLTQPPLAEYFLLHIKLLSGYDPFTNLVQWISMCGSVICVSLITKELGGNRKTQLLSAFFCATIPMGILQSTSTQNDYVVSFFIVCGLLFGVKGIKNNFSFKTVFCFFISCGLSLITKGTAYLFLFPVMIIYASVLIYKKKFNSIAYLSAGLFIVVVLNFPQAGRNYTIYKNPLGKSYDLNNEAYGVAPMLSNISKNVAMHLRTPVPALNEFFTSTVIDFNNLIGINTYSEKYNWHPSPKFEVGYFSTQEDAAGNFFHVILFAVCVCVFIFSKQLRTNKSLLIYLLVLILMFFTFCYVLKWQVWHSRLHLPMFVAGSVFLAFVSERLGKIFNWTMVIIFFLFSCVFLFFNQSRSWFLKKNIFNETKNEQYFITNKTLQKPFTNISLFIHENNLKNIGWLTSGDTWEYPMWFLLSDVDSLRMENISPENETASLEKISPFNSFVPDGIIVTRFAPDTTGNIFYKEKKYHLMYNENKMSFYERKSD